METEKKLEYEKEKAEAGGNVRCDVDQMGSSHDKMNDCVFFLLIQQFSRVIGTPFVQRTNSSIDKIMVFLLLI